MNKYYIKPLICWFAFLLTVLAFTFLAGCAAKPMASEKTTYEDKQVTTNDSVATTDHNQVIIDSLVLAIAKVRTAKPECDSICQLEVDRLLARLNTQKISGTNSYGISYNQNTGNLKAYATIGETVDQKVKVAKASAIATKITVTKTIPVKYTPAFMKYSAYFGWLFAIVLIYKLYRKITTLWLPKSPLT